MDKKKLLIFITIILEWYVINKVIKKEWVLHLGILKIAKNLILTDYLILI